MNKQKNQLIYLYLFLVMIGTFFLGTQEVFAANKNVYLNELNYSYGFSLKTVRNEKEFIFTKPHTWNLTSSPVLNLVLQHSAQLLPDRSYLIVFLNGQQVKKIPLDHSTIKAKTVSIPLPSGSIIDYNTVKIFVEQHYTTHCEDPTDQSLWTFVLPDTHIVFNYDRKPITQDLKAYPYPLIDNLEYSPLNLTFVIPDSSKLSIQSLNAMAIANSDLAQNINWKNYKAKVSTVIPNDKNVVFVGTPDESNLIRSMGINKANGSDGYLYYGKNPKNPKYTMLVITGASPEGVLKAAKYLSHNELIAKTKGSTLLVKDYAPSQLESSHSTKYVINKAKTFKELGIETTEVKYMSAPAIETYLRVIPSLREDRIDLPVDLVYSYGPDLNPEFSVLEVKVNGVSVHTVQLNNRLGEQNKITSFKIPYPVLDTVNKTEFIFKFFPEKMGYCVDYPKLDFWGKIHDSSKVNLTMPGTIKLPDLGLLNDTGFPYTQDQDLSDVTVVLSGKINAGISDALLDITNRLGKGTFSEQGINLNLVKLEGGALPQGNVIVIDDGSGNFQKHVSFESGFKKLTWGKGQETIFNTDSHQGYIEQLGSASYSQAVTIFYSNSMKGLSLSSNTIADNDKLSDIQHDVVLAQNPNVLKSVYARLVEIKGSKIKETAHIYEKEPQSDGKQVSDVVIKVVFILVISIILVLISNFIRKVL